MRITITLDSDVHVMLQTAMKEHGISFDEALNSAVRLGLMQGERRGFTQKTYALGAFHKFSWDKALEIAAIIEDEDLIQKLALFT